MSIQQIFLLKIHSKMWDILTGLSSTPDSLEYVVSIKNILQNIFLGNINNNGFKIVSDEKNYPFDSVWFLLNDTLRLPKIEIVYVYNED